MKKGTLQVQERVPGRRRLNKTVYLQKGTKAAASPSMLESIESFLEKLNFFVLEENKRLGSSAEGLRESSLGEKKALAEELNHWVLTLKTQPGLADQKQSGVFLEKIQKLILLNLENEKRLQRLIHSTPEPSSSVAPRALRVYGH